MIRRNRRLKLTVVLAGVFVCALLPSRLLAQDLQTAENILLYQRDSGGWPKNHDRKQVLTEAQRRGILNDKSKCDAMIDTGYSWLGPYAQGLLAEDLPRWRHASRAGPQNPIRQ